ncbi:MAG: hypothetical protein HKM87_04170, partial [Ignavibacteriaceae bacterium]|nr:hypothetical protein [Ignavibacteriaceae bacterium]
MKILFDKMKDKSKRIKIGLIHSFTLIFLLYSLIFTAPGCAQEVADSNVQICDSKFNHAVDEKLVDKPINEVIVEIGKSFTGTDYAAHT